MYNKVYVPVPDAVYRFCIQWLFSFIFIHFHVMYVNIIIFSPF